MAFIGNTNTTQAFTPAVDYFSGNASTTAFTLSKPVASVVQVQAVIENVPQNPSSAFTVSGNTITFTSAPPSGTNNIYVYYTSPITQVLQPSQGTVGVTQLSASGTASSSTYLRGDNTWATVTSNPGTVTSIDTGNGLSGGTITSSGTLTIACPTNNTVGSYALGGNSSGSAFTAGTNYSAGSSSGQVSAASLYTYVGDAGGGYFINTGYPSFTNNLSGTWKCMNTGASGSAGGSFTLFCRVA